MAKEGGHTYNTASRTLLVLTILFILASFVLVGRIIQIKYFWEPDPRALRMREFKVQSSSVKLEALRGNILDCNGKLLATSIPRYDIQIDCQVQKKAYQEQTDKVEGSNKTIGMQNEEEWKRDLKAFTKGLARILNDGSARRPWKKTYSDAGEVPIPKWPKPSPLPPVYRIKNIWKSRSCLWQEGISPAEESSRP